MAQPPAYPIVADRLAKEAQDLRTAAGRLSPTEVTIARLGAYLACNADVLTADERRELLDAIDVLARVDPVLRRAGR